MGTRHRRLPLWIRFSNRLDTVGCMLLRTFFVLLRAPFFFLSFAHYISSSSHFYVHFTCYLYLLTTHQPLYQYPTSSAYLSYRSISTVFRCLRSASLDLIHGLDYVNFLHSQSGRFKLDDLEVNPGEQKGAQYEDLPPQRWCNLLCSTVS